MPRRTLWLAITLVVCLVVGAAPAVAQAKEAAPGRVVAIGDVHGDYDALAAILQQAGLIDAKLKWKGGDATLVQTGDFLDRGPKDRQVMDLLMTLEKEAPKKGGRVVVLLGNHEVMNLVGDVRYVSPQAYAGFADKNSEKRRVALWQEYVEFQKAAARAKGQPEPVATPEAEKAWLEAHPPGFLEHHLALGPLGKYGSWLRAHPVAARIGTSVFLHGGISPALAALASSGLEAINQRIREEITAFDDRRQYLVERKVVLPFFRIEEMTLAAQAELDARNAEISQKSAEAAAAGKLYKPDHAAQTHIRVLSGFLEYPTWLSFHAEGPVWFRGYAEWPEEQGTAQVTALLAAYNAEQFVVGHTPQRDGRIKVRFGGKVFLIDTGMLSGYYPGGRASALEIQAGKFTAIYPDERVSLLDRGVARGDGQPSNGPELEEEELPGGPSAGRPRPAQAQEPAPAAAPAKAARVWLGPDGQPLPFKSDDEILEFLRTAKPGRMKGIPVGITGPREVTLEKDGIRVKAAFRTLDEEKTQARLASGATEMFFRDSYIFEPAAYEMARLLGLDNVPPAVERRVYGEKGSVQIWVENAMMEKDRQKNKVAPPDAVRWNHQVQIMRVFDNLIYNTDRNMGNILIDRDWKLWMIDHTRAFRRHPDLVAPQGVAQCERGLLQRLKALDAAETEQRLKPYLRKVEIEALLKRRDQLVSHIERLIAERGEDKVIFDRD